MRKFLVVSYNGNQQQWHWDRVMAASADAAKAKVLRVRDYCLDADAIPLDELESVAAGLRQASQAVIREEWRQFEKESK